MDAATIEETNRLRVAMGMKPLPVPGAKPAAAAGEEDEDPSATFEGRQAQATANWKKIRDAEDAKKQRDEKAAAVKKARERAQRYTVLGGKGLGEVDDVDVKTWLKGSKKKQKQFEKEQKLAEQESRKATAKQHTSRDLAGVQIAHDMSTLLDGDDQVLTLKDTSVLANEDDGDELENLDLLEKERVGERLELKRKRPIYDPNDIDETGERSILGQYDEEIYGKKKKRFTLDGQGSVADVAHAFDSGSGDNKKLESLSLDILNDVPASDYLDISEVKVRKPKKKKSKATRQRPVDDDILFPGDDVAGDNTEGLMDIDSGTGTFTKKKKKLVEEDFVDDDDLQATLARQRGSALKKRKRMRPEDIAKQLREEEESPGVASEKEDQRSGLVIDEVSEFVSALKKTDEEENDKPRTKKPIPEASTTAMDEDSAEEDMDAPMVDVVESPAGDVSADWQEEKSVGEGLAATLSILRERNLLQENQGSALNSNFRHHEQFVAEKNRRLAAIDEDAKKKRESDRASGVLDRMSARDREEYARSMNAQREYETSKALNDMFQRDYTPNFNIKYTDEFGRSLSSKEAFKELSHQFHGKSSGKGKTDKKLRKIEEERRQEARSMLDASQSVGMSSATEQQLKKRKEAGVRLA